MIIRTNSFSREDRGRVYHTQFSWQEDTFIQGGSRGIVFRQDGSSYRTAFVEAFSPQIGFIRGEGEDIADAEKEAWQKAQKIFQCPGHEVQPCHYRNGGGICTHCNRFFSQFFTASDLGQFCRECNEPTFESDHLGFACKQHITGHEFLAKMEELNPEDDQWFDLYGQYRRAQAEAKKQFQADQDRTMNTPQD